MGGAGQDISDEVRGRWAAPGSGEHYVSARWAGKGARERDPRLLRQLLGSLPEGGPPLASVGRVLDVPSGTGRLYRALEELAGDAARNGWIVQSDISSSMLQAGREAQLAGTGPRIQCSAAALPFADDSFDLVVCCRLLHHLKDRSERQAVLRELVRVSGRFVAASYWDAASYGAWRRRTRVPLLRRTKRADLRVATPWAELTEDLAATGADVRGRVHSMRWVSQQSFFLAEIRS